MKIVEMTNTVNNSQALFEELDAKNESGFATQDLVKIVQSHSTGDWKTVTTDELDNMMSELWG